MTDRSNFLKQLSAAGIASCVPGILGAKTFPAIQSEVVTNDTNKIWACFMHLSFNFAGGIRNWGGIRKEFEPDQSLWDDATKRYIKRYLQKNFA